MWYASPVEVQRAQRTMCHGAAALCLCRYRDRPLRPTEHSSCGVCVSVCVCACVPRCVPARPNALPSLPSPPSLPLKLQLSRPPTLVVFVVCHQLLVCAFQSFPSPPSSDHPPLLRAPCVERWLPQRSCAPVVRPLLLSSVRHSVRSLCLFSFLPFGNKRRRETALAPLHVRRSADHLPKEKPVRTVDECGQAPPTTHRRPRTPRVSSLPHFIRGARLCRGKKRIAVPSPLGFRSHELQLQVGVRESTRSLLSLFLTM